MFEYVGIVWHRSENCYHGWMVDFLELASTRATEVLFFNSGFLHDDNLCSAFMIRTDKALRFDNHTWPPFNPMLLNPCADEP